MLGVLPVQAVAAIVAGFVFVSILIPILCRPAKRLGLIDLPGGRKEHMGAIPLIGGVAMFIAFCAALLIIPDGLRPYASLVVGMGLLLATGMVDDALDISPMAKLSMQVFAAVLMVSWGEVQIHSLGNLIGVGNIELGEWAIPFTVLCTVLMINAINLADGTDGLAGGISLIVLLFLAGLGWVNGIGSAFVAVTLLLAAVLVGFLLFNFRTPWRKCASVFMGDAGSMMLGFAIAWLAVFYTEHPETTVYPVTIAWIVVLPVTDLVSSYFRRILRGRSPFSADREHLHHILLRARFSVPVTVGILLVALTVFASVGVAGWLLEWPEYLMFIGLLVVFLVHYLFCARAWKLMRWISRGSA